MVIERTENELVFKMPYSSNIDELQDLEDLFQYFQITQKSKATQEDVDNLVEEIKKGRWNRTKKMIENENSY
ncbi:MAG: hypothetical protein RO257_05735 [Candidatus Kapabacteria bacterium]|jgi:hypothetical protein|nr:hypothetical protein [Candidatus Kapabacteria bacterium]